MSALARRTIEGEILARGASIRVVGRRHPLAGDRFDRDLPAGLSISEIIEAVADRRRRDYHVALDGHVVLERHWHRVRVKPGVTVTVLPRLQGGANNQVLRSTLSIVVAVAALVIATAVAGPAGFALTAGSTAYAVTTALVSAAIITAGSLAINALFPISAASVAGGAPGTLNSIQGAQNQAAPFAPVPVVLGRHRLSPYYAAKPYTEISGADQYLRLLFCVGYGPLEIEDIRIGETPIAQFDGVTVEIRQGFADDDPVTLYPGSVDEVALQVELDAPIDAAFSPANPGDWHAQVTAAETDHISLDFTAVEGIFARDPKGSEVYFSVPVEVQYRLAGSGGAWTTPPDGEILSKSTDKFGSASSGTVIFSRSVDPTRRGVVIVVARGQYEVRCRRAVGRGAEEYTRDRILWTALRSIKNEPPVDFPKPLALIALRIKATDQLSGVVDTLNCVATSLVTAWSGAEWVAETASQNPADLFRHVLQGNANARPVADELVDLDNLAAFWDYCDGKGFQFNQVRTAVAALADALDDICAAGRAVKTFIDGKWGVAWDRPDSSIVQHFTPRNSWDFQGQRAYAQKPHGWRVTFINEENGFTQDERLVFDDGYDEDNATLFEGIQFPGVTRPDLVWKHGRFHIAQSRLRPEKFSLNVGWENLLCQRTDRVRVTHDAMLVGLASGRIKAVASQVVTLDETVTIEAGKTYAFHFRVAAEARTIDRAVDEATPAGDYRELTLVGDLSGLAAGDLWGFGLTDRASGDYRVQAIRSLGDLGAALTLVDDAPAIDLADQGAIPAYVPNVTIPPDPYTLPPRDLRYAELIDGQGAAARALVHLSWQVPRFGNIRIFEVQLQDVDNDLSWTTVAPGVAPPATAVDVPITRAGVYSFRVRCLFNNGTASAWSTLSNVNLAALSTAPGNVTNLHQRSVDGQTVLDWTIVEDRRLLNYEIRKGTSWDTGLVVGDVVAQPPWPTTGDGTYHVRAYVLSPFGTRIYSPASASISIADSVRFRNIIIERDEQATGWGGGIGLDGGVVDGPFIRTDVASSIATPAAQAVIDDLELTGDHIAVFISGQIVNIGRPLECRFWTEFDGVGVLQGADFLGTSDFLGQSDVLGAGPTRSIECFPVWRFASDGESDVFGPSDIFAEADIFTAGINWGPWTKVAQGTRVERYFQAGLVLITHEETVDATGTKFSWFVDVPDRTDDYTDLAVPDSGLAVTFHPGGYDGSPLPGSSALAFNGGPNGAAVPHVQRAIVDETAGDEVRVTDLTAAGCTVHVLNAGSPVTRSGVNLLVRGY